MTTTLKSPATPATPPAKPPSPRARPVSQPVKPADAPARSAGAPARPAIPKAKPAGPQARPAIHRAKQTNGPAGPASRPARAVSAPAPAASQTATPTRAIREVSSFRLPTGTLARLDARAKAVGATRTAIAEQFLEEGLRLVDHPGIAFRDGPSGRRAGIGGTGLDVWEVIETVQANGGTIEAAAEYLGVPPAYVLVAMRYHAAFPGEIEERLVANRTAYERERDLASRQHELLR